MTGDVACPAAEAAPRRRSESGHKDTPKAPVLCLKGNEQRASQDDDGYSTRNFSFAEAESSDSHCDILEEHLSAVEVNCSFSASELASLCHQSVVVTGSLEQQVHTESLERAAPLEQRVAELEKHLEAGAHTHLQEFQEQYTRDLRETIQLCETLMSEKAAVAAERDLIEQEFCALREENQTLRQEKEHLLRDLQEKREVEEFRALEQESTRQYEEELLSEISSLKKSADKSAAYIQNLEADLAAMSAELKRKDEWIVELQGLRNKDSAQEIRQLKRSLEDAETLSRDARKEWAVLRTEMVALREKEVDMTTGYTKMEAELQRLRERLELEKTRFKKMQADLQKELHKVFQENVELSSLVRERDHSDVESEALVNLRKELEGSQERERTLQARLAKLECFSKLPVEDNSVKQTGDHTGEPCLGKSCVDASLACVYGEDQQGAEHVQGISMSQECAGAMELQEEAGEKLQPENLREDVETTIKDPDSVLCAQLQDELEDLRSHMTSITKERDQLLEEVGVLQEEVSHFRRLLQESEMAAVLQQCLDLEQPSQDKGEQPELQQQIQRLGEELYSVKAEKEHLQARLELLIGASPEEVALLELRRSSVDRGERRLRSRLEQARSQLEAMQQSLVALEEARAEAEHQVSTHKEAMHLLQTELQETCAQLELKNTTIRALEQKLAQVCGALGLQKPRSPDFQMDLERADLSSCHQEELVKPMALDHREETVWSVTEVLVRPRKPADKSIVETSRGRTVLSPLLTERDEVKQLKSDVHESHVADQRGQAAKWRRRATKLKENRSEMSPHTTPTRRRCLILSEGHFFESPKSKFFDVRHNAVHLNRPRQFFDNSSLGTIPEVAFPPAGAAWAHLRALQKDLDTTVEENGSPLPSSPRQDNCKAQ
ncbi:centromere-associated protein E-like isoform X1 [Scleropages formosus]|uniref:centromere-associated protein E-like isoform X1 n=1 Tax=Scleropages formosus TaxID=113540 RepID=UPI0010FAC6FD|nr:centromere-associated protein E-like isoform X1 [Scleropages formosus]